MLFVTSKPVQTQIFEDRKVIVLTNNKIMFSHLDFIEQYLAMPLITTRPKSMCYESSVMQAMVVSETTVQVYYCDWKTQIKLIRVIILNNQSVDGVCYDKQSGWHIFGSMSQYEPTRINFHKSRDIQATALAKCYIDKNRYLLTNDKLQKSEGVQDFKDVLWKDRMMVLKNSNYKVAMKGAKTQDRKKDIICINQTYVLLVSKFEVLQTFMEPIVVYMQNSLLISHIDKEKLVSIQKCQNNTFAQLGIIQKENAEIKGAFLYEDQLTLLQYEDRQIHLRNLPLTSQADNTQNSKKGKKRLFQSISRIMEESQQDGSQFISKQDKQQSVIKYPYIEASQRAETHYHPNEKPVIRDIQLNDDEVKSHSLDDNPSEVLSRSGIDGERQSHNNLSEAEEQMSFQMTRKQKKASPKYKHKSVPFQTKRQHSADNFKNETASEKLKNGNQQKKKFENSFNEADASYHSKSSRKNLNKYKNKNESFQNSSINQNASFEEHAETPAFGFEAFGSDKWGDFDKQWNQAANNQINQEVQQEMQQSLCVTEEQSILKFMPEKQSKKVQVFKPVGAILTTELYNKIQKESYCSLISKAIEHDPDKIQQYLDMFLVNVLDEAQAPLFFQKNIRTFNPQFTQDKIRKLFGSIIQNKQMKSKIASALQLFKVSEVPQQVIPFPNDFVKIILLLCKQIYIEDLLKPSQSTIDYILSSYFSIDSFRQEVITIQDEEIDITHPRNMLNILLYLNQYLGVKIEIAIKVYCAKLLEQDHLDILKKITVKQNIFEICQVPRSILDQVVIQRFNQLLNESVQNAEYLWSIIQFLSPQCINEYRIRLAIISEFNKCNIIFDLNTLINIKEFQNDIFLFLEKIISENSSRNLANLKFSSIYRSLYWLQEGEKVMHVTYEYIELVKSLAEKFCQKKMFYEGFHLLNTILSKIKTSFIAKLLKTYLKSKYLNRLIDIQLINLESVFPQLMNSPDIDPTALPHDKVKIPQYSPSLSCSWGKYLSIFQKYLDGPVQLKVFVFCQINAANQLYLTLDENVKQKFVKFIEEIHDNIIIELDDINENDNSVNPKGSTSLLFQQHQKEDLESEVATSTLNRQDVLLSDDHQKISKKIVYKSMTLIDHFNQISSHKLLRRNSDKKYNSDSLLNQNEDLLRVRLLVNRKQIIEQLQQIYTNKDLGIFIHSLKLIDLEKVQLFHLDVFKAIFYKEIEYCVSRILPFQMFLVEDCGQAFQLCREKIMSEVNVRNFWVIFTIIQLLFKKGEQVCSIFLQKCITYLRNDSYTTVMRQIIKIIQPSFNKQFLKSMIEQAKGYGLHQTTRLLQQYSS